MRFFTTVYIHTCRAVMTRFSATCIYSIHIVDKILSYVLYHCRLCWISRHFKRDPSLHLRHPRIVRRFANYGPSGWSRNTQKTCHKAEMMMILAPNGGPQRVQPIAEAFSSNRITI